MMIALKNVDVSVTDKTIQGVLYHNEQDLPATLHVTSGWYGNPGDPDRRDLHSWKMMVYDKHFTDVIRFELSSRQQHETMESLIKEAKRFGFRAV